MDLKVYTRKTKRAHQPTFELLDEMVWEILIRLPVQSLARCKSVSKAWLAIISDPSFVVAHLQCSKERQHQNPSSLLVTPQILVEPGPVVGAFSTSIRFYRWSLQEDQEDTKGTATLAYGRNFPATEFSEVSTMAHCDGLMLLPTDTKAYVFNPATRDAIALSQSQHKHDDCLLVGLGLDTSTGKYKVARAFYRSRSSEMVAMGMEVFTINGEEDSWRETLVDPPYPLLDPQTATHCKGHLFYFMDRENNQQYVPQGLLRFSLVDETFGVTPLPPSLYDMIEDEGEDVHLDELGGELYATIFIEGLQQVLIFVTSDVLNPDWNCRYAIDLRDKFYPLALHASGRILMRGGNQVIDYNLEYDIAHKDGIFDMDDIRYLGPNEDILGHEWQNVGLFDISSYTESLVPVTSKASLRAL